MIIGVIGGSGLYQLREGEKPRGKHDVKTPFGATSGSVFEWDFGENTALFVARHGEGHVVTPSEVNYRANVYALKKLGARALISVSAVGSMKKEVVPGEFILPDQYIDVTKGLRPNTYFGDGVVAHAHFADPTCSKLRETLAATASRTGTKCHVGGTYVCIEGPQFSTRAESHLYRSWGVDVIGMTALPEARLAREAGLCYQTVAMATDYDCWNTDNEDVSVEAILNTLRANVNTARKLVASQLSEPMSGCDSCRESMHNAVLTAKDRWPKNRREVLDFILS